MGTNAIHMSIDPEIEKLGRKLAKCMDMSFSRMVSGFIVKFGLEAENFIIESGYAEEVIFSDLARKLNTELKKLRFKVEA